MSEELFDKGPTTPATPASTEPAGGTPRLRVPQRDQVEMHWRALDEMLEPDHPARAVWAAVNLLDMSRWLVNIRAVEGHVGRNATLPQLLLALWVYATLEGVGSARELERLCGKHLAFQWLCGGVGVNYHLLSDFRSQNREAWDELLTQIVAGLTCEGLVEMKRVAQDGMRVRASAGKSSFRRIKTLRECQADAQQQVEALKELEDDAHELTQRQKAARERAARERAERVEQAIRHCQELQVQREAQAKISGKKVIEARASTTDPEARNMKFPNGGYQPGYNVQFATDTASGIIVGVDVVNDGADSEQLPPMLDQLQERYDKVPDQGLVDGGFVSKEAIIDAAAQGCTVFAPLKEEQKQLDAGKDPYAAKKGDKPAVAQWRARMGTAAAKAIYKLRAQTAEWVNAQARNRGFQQMPVRGRPKCRIVALLFAITHNVMHGLTLRAKVAMGD
jgi:transposase